MKSPDKICNFYAKKGVKVKIKDMGDFILIEGDYDGLRFLSELIGAQAESEKDCGFQIFPSGAGSRLFDKESDLGIYIHKIC